MQPTSGNRLPYPNVRVASSPVIMGDINDDIKWRTGEAAEIASVVSCCRAFLSDWAPYGGTRPRLLVTPI